MQKKFLKGVASGMGRHARGLEKSCQDELVSEVENLLLMGGYDWKNPLELPEPVTIYAGTSDEFAVGSLYLNPNDDVVIVYGNGDTFLSDLTIDGLFRFVCDLSDIAADEIFAQGPDE